MKHWAYYNEIDSYAAGWIRNLIKAGHVAPGLVDERSIEDVHPADVREFTQCHWFAGIAVWSLALRRAGWPDDRPVWTGSCPCQPFSAAGAGVGFADERHLWPHFHHLIAERRPPAVLGEQVASRDADPWIDLVQDDLEGLGYRVGAVPFPAAGVGAPHIRDRLYWVAHAHRHRRTTLSIHPRNDTQHHAEPRGELGRLEYPRQHYDAGEGQAPGAGQPQADGSADQPGRSGIPSGWLGHTHSFGAGWVGRTVSGQVAGQDGQHLPVDADAPGAGMVARPGPTNGHWAAADWLACQDGRWRPVEPGTFPLAHGAPARVGRLRAYGNAICAPAAETFIRAVMETLGSPRAA